jgi:hypothetical protein
MQLSALNNGGKSPEKAFGGRADLLLKHLLGDLPDHLKPTERAHRLVVAVVWGSDHLLDLREAKANGKLTLGADPGADVQVFHDVTRLGRVPFVDRTHESTRLFLPAGAPARIWLGGRELTTVDVLEENIGERVRVPVDGVWIELGLHDRLTLQFGQVRVIARYLAAQDDRRPSPFDLEFWSRVAIYVMTAVTLYRMALITDFTPLF